jgi:hypothetical protein
MTATKTKKALKVETVDFNVLQQIREIALEAKEVIGHLNFYRVECIGVVEHHYLDHIKTETKKYRDLLEKAERLYRDLNESSRIVCDYKFCRPFSVVSDALKSNYMIERYDS